MFFGGVRGGTPETIPGPELADSRDPPSFWAGVGGNLQKNAFLMQKTPRNGTPGTPPGTPLGPQIGVKGVPDTREGVAAGG